MIANQHYSELPATWSDLPPAASILAAKPHDIESATSLIAASWKLHDTEPHDSEPAASSKIEKPHDSEAA